MPCLLSAVRRVVKIAQHGPRRASAYLSEEVGLGLSPDWAKRKAG